MQVEQLCACGLEQAEAEALLPEMEAALKRPTEEAWLHLSRELLKPEHPFALHQLLYRTVYAEEKDGVLWAPSASDIERAHVTALARELSLDSYAELHAYSARERSAFWARAVKSLGIRFRVPCQQVLDLALGAQRARFFVGSELNIAESCFSAPAAETAIVFQREGGRIERWSYGELERMTRRVAASLVVMGLEPGDRVAVDMPMTAESVAVYLGIIWAGCTVVAIADSFAADEIATRLELSSAKVIFTQDIIERGGKALPLYTRVTEAGAPRAVVLPGRGAEVADKLRTGDISWAEFLGKEEMDVVPCSPEDYSNILFSSGTTGTPKAIPWDHITPIKCAADGYFHQDIHPGEVVAWPTNLGWMMGPWLIYAALVNRATMALYYGAPTGRDFGLFVEEAQVNMLGTVPSLVRTWRASDCMRGLDWSAIRAFSSTGECSNGEDMHWLMALAGYKPVIEYCGGTELAGGYIAATMVHKARAATFTTPALGMDMVILNDWGSACENGEVFLLPPSVGMSTKLIHGDHYEAYYADAPKAGGVGLRRHGDQIERVAEGIYRIHGRVDDSMNLGGIKVSSAQIERLLNAVDGVGETAAVAVSPKGGGPSQLVVFVVLDRSVEDLQVQLQEMIRQQLNPLFKIKAVVVVESLPRTASNKVMRRVMREQYCVQTAPS